MGSFQVMVTGVGGPAGRAVSDYFQEQGIGVLRADMCPLESSFGFRTLPPATDLRFIGALLAILEEEGISLLVPTVTEELPVVACQREVIRSKGCAAFVCSPHAAEVANDKWRTSRALFEAGIPVPRSCCGCTKTELLDSIGLPALSKPRIGRGGRGILIHRSAEEISDTLPADRVYQEFLPGEEYDVNLFAEPGGEPSTTIVLKKTLLKSGVVGNALAVERVEESDVADLAQWAVRALSLEGPIDLDIRRREDGRPAILEINARVGANVRFAEEVLIEILSNWRKHCSLGSGKRLSLSTSA